MMIQLHFPFLRVLLAVGTVVCALAYAPRAAADAARIDFTLFSYINGAGDQLFSDGSGFFIVEDTFPAMGTVTVVASDLQGMAGLATTGRLTPFGYAYGNTFEYFVGSPLDGNISVVQTPHQDARITFVDGLVTGISYTESHTCDTGHHCEPGLTPAGNMYMSGLFYDFQRSYPHVSAGTIVIAVPEVGTGVLMLAGIALLGAALGKKDSLHNRTRLEANFGEVPA